MNNNVSPARKRRRVRATAICMAVLLLLAAAVGIYAGDYYRADEAAVAAFAAEPQFTAVTRESPKKGVSVFRPETPVAGLIFYPGGKVETEAYAPLMEACAAEGILCVLTDMPLRLAVLDLNAADDIPELYPEIQRWYIGGHSLGGAMASYYIDSHADAYEGLVLLGAYCSPDISASGLRALSIYGSEDGVLNRSKYDECKSHLPADTTEIVLNGGCHAGFGAYGPQKGDGVPTLPRPQQIARTAEAIGAFVAGNEA